jgi:hypothetical protein
MTAYLSRVRLTGQEAGIRPRPRSRYEPDPATRVANSGMEVEEVDYQVEAERLGPTATLRRARAAPSVDVPTDQPRSAREQAIRFASSAQVMSTAHPERPGSPDADVAAYAAFQSPVDTREAAGGTLPQSIWPTARERSVAAGPVPAETDWRADSPSSDTSSRRDGHREAPPARQAVRSTSSLAPDRRATTGDIDVTVDAPATSRRASGERATGDDARTAPKPDLDDGGALVSRPPRLVDSGVRRAIANAISEPERAEPNEVNVYIARIDVQAPSPRMEASQPRPSKASPTSLESYLRARSRRA